MIFFTTVDDFTKGVSMKFGEFVVDDSKGICVNPLDFNEMHISR